MYRFKRVAVLAAISAKSLCPQLAALLMLPTREFGIFSLVYLTFSLGVSVLLSVVSEAHTRKMAIDPAGCSIENYSAIATWSAVLFGAVAGVLLAIFSDGPSTPILAALAITLAVRRSPIRYYEQRSRRWNRLLKSESAALAAFLIVLWLSFGNLSAMGSILAAWTASGLISWLAGTKRSFGTPRGAILWFRQYRTQIRPLLADSALLDLSSVGAPYILSPILGLGSFGVYRAVSNMGVPIRLIMNFMRPQMSTKRLSALLSMRTAGLIAMLSTAVLVPISAVLAWAQYHPLGIDVLDSLAPFWLPTSLYLFSAPFGYFYYFVARNYASGDQLRTGRLWHTVITAVLPIAGASAGGIFWAIWMYAFATMAGGLVWMLIGWRRLSEGST